MFNELVGKYNTTKPCASKLATARLDPDGGNGLKSTWNPFAKLHEGPLAIIIRPS